MLTEFDISIPSAGTDSPSTKRIISPFCKSVASIRVSWLIPTLPIDRSGVTHSWLSSSSNSSEATLILTLGCLITSLPVISLAWVALRFVNLCTAAAVWPLAWHSKYFPRITTAISTAAVSKNSTSSLRGFPWTIPCRRPKRENVYAAIVPDEIRKSIPRVPRHIDMKAFLWKDQPDHHCTTDANINKEKP